MIQMRRKRDNARVESERACERRKHRESRFTEGLVRVLSGAARVHCVEDRPVRVYLFICYGRYPLREGV